MHAIITVIPNIVHTKTILLTPPTFVKSLWTVLPLVTGSINYDSCACSNVNIKGVILTVPGSVWFGSVRNRSDFDASGSVNRKRVYGSVRNQSEPSS